MDDLDERVALDAFPHEGGERISVDSEGTASWHRGLLGAFEELGPHATELGLEEAGSAVVTR